MGLWHSSKIFLLFSVLLVEMSVYKKIHCGIFKYVQRIIDIYMMLKMI